MGRRERLWLPEHGTSKALKKPESDGALKGFSFGALWTNVVYVGHKTPLSAEVLSLVDRQYKTAVWQIRLELH